MRKVWALVDVDDTIMGNPFNTQEEAQNAKDNLSYFGDLLDVREINLNEEPLDEEGERLKEELRSMFKDVVNFHITKTAKWFEMPPKERFRTIINTFNQLDEHRSSEAPGWDEDIEQIDVKDFVRKLFKP